MNKNTLIGFVSLAALVAFVAFLIFATPAREPSAPVSNQQDSSVRGFVGDFASKFKNVSLLADDVADQIAREYAPYASADLIAKWQSHVEEAPGRHTSSPWPDRIEIVSVEAQSNGSYIVDGNVIEVTCAETPMEPAAVYPITITVMPSGDSWVVTALEKGAYSKLSERTSVIGFWECLPHRETSGPQTLECAFGLKREDESYLAVCTQLMSTYPVDFPTGTKVRIDGILVPIENVSSNLWQKYDIEGIIDATTITKI